jgi:hypothetical protein
MSDLTNAPAVSAAHSPDLPPPPTPTADVIRLMREGARLRITRTLVYEGPVDWLVKTLEQSQLTGPGAMAHFTQVPSFRSDCRLVCTGEEIEEVR